MPLLPKGSAIALLTWLLCGCAGPAIQAPARPAKMAEKPPSSGGKAKAEAAPEPAPPVASAWLRDRKGACADAVRAHLARRGEPGLEVAGQWLVRECESKKWSDRGRACVAAAEHEDALLRCRAAEGDRADDAALAAGLIPKTGITECDRYYLEFRRCIRRVAPDAVEQTTRGLVAAAAAMRNTAPANRGPLAKGCEDTRKSLREQFPQCQWSTP